MRVFIPLGLLMAMVLTVCGEMRGRDVETPASRLARSRLARHQPQKRTAYKDFLLSNIYTTTLTSLNGTDCKHTVSFDWVDQNSNTSTICDASWTETSNSSTAPTSYIVCDEAAPNEEYQWYFKSYTNASEFEFQLAHEFEDDVDFQFPYDYPEFFAVVNVSLTCTAHPAACYQPADQTPLHAVIDGISD